MRRSVLRLPNVADPVDHLPVAVTPGDLVVDLHAENRIVVGLIENDQNVIVTDAATGAARDRIVADLLRPTRNNSSSD